MALKNRHPGLIIKDAILDVFELSNREVALYLNVAPSTFNNIIRGRANISPEMALRLSKCFTCFSAMDLLELQNKYDLEIAILNTDLSLIKKYKP